MSEADTPTNLTFTESVNSVNSTEADQATPYSSDSPDAQRSHLRSIQQHQEFRTTQEHLKCLLHELETSHQTVQRQQILIETLTTQLESSQERVAQMERECFLAQQRYNEQSHQLVQTQNTCRDLQTRLTRQQRHTLQFKLALEKCLEVHVPSQEFQLDRDLKKAPYPCALSLPKAQPIQAWSAQAESLTNELESTWDSQLFPAPSSSWEEEQGSREVGAVPYAHPEQGSAPLPLPEVVPSLEQTFEEQSDDVVEHDLRHFLDDSASELVPPDQTTQFQFDELPQQETSCFTSSSNWPSPVVYPLRPPKGRKSLAAIELPTFT